MPKQDSWLDLYLEYTKNSESPRSFHFWTGVSVVAAALGRKVWVDFGLLQVYPNFYIVLVAPPGRCRKTQAIRAGENILRLVPNVCISSDAITREALIKDLALSSKTFLMDGGDQPISHCSVTLISTELSVFLGQRNLPMLSLLNELYDCKDIWEYKTKLSGKDTIYGVWFNLLGATTPEWLISSLPVDAIGGGMTSRTIFVVESGRMPKVTKPTRDEQVQEELSKRLEVISQYEGEMSLEEEAYEKYDHWYQKMPDDGGEFSERKHIIVLKLAMVLAASENRAVIEASDIERGVKEIETIEPRMSEALGGVGKSKLSTAINTILSILREREEVAIEELMQTLWRDVTYDDLDDAILAVKAMGLAETVIRDKKYYVRRTS